MRRHSHMWMGGVYSLSLINCTLMKGMGRATSGGQVVDGEVVLVQSNAKKTMHLRQIVKVKHNKREFPK